MKSCTSLICSNTYLAILFFICISTTKDKNKKQFLILEYKGKRGLHMCTKSFGRLELHNKCRLSNCLTRHGGGSFKTFLLHLFIWWRKGHSPQHDVMVREQLARVFTSFHHVTSRDQTQVGRVGGDQIYPQSHLPGQECLLLL